MNDVGPQQLSYFSGGPITFEFVLPSIQEDPFDGSLYTH